MNGPILPKLRHIIWKTIWFPRVRTYTDWVWSFILNWTVERRDRQKMSYRVYLYKRQGCEMMIRKSNCFKKHPCQWCKERHLIFSHGANFRANHITSFINTQSYHLTIFIGKYRSVDFTKEALTVTFWLREFVKNANSFRSQASLLVWTIANWRLTWNSHACWG